MAVGDLLPDTGDELVVTTMAGDLYVFGLQGNQFTQLYRTWVAGGLGHYNSIVIADLDASASAPGPELYLAGSLGIRKFFRQGGAP